MLFEKDDNLRFPWLGATVGIILGVVVHLLGGSDDAIAWAVFVPFLAGFFLYLKKEKEKNAWIDKAIDDAFEKSEKLTK
jgi:uncharacterized membrane protein YgaE (UPF0421/DUF939 family)